MKYGIVVSFNSIKQSGVIKDNRTNQEYTFLKSDCPHAVEMLDEVAYDIEEKRNKMVAVNVKLG